MMLFSSRLRLRTYKFFVNATQEWCKSMDMSLNGAKTQYLLVNPDPRTLSTSLEVSGVSISPVQEVKYLGLQIHAKNGLQAGVKNLEQGFWIAWEDLTRAYSNLGCSMSMMLMTELHLACLPPLISPMDVKSGHSDAFKADNCLRENLVV
jgi:hypothetical protein